MKDWIKLLRLAAYFGQLGFTLITPPVVMALLGWWLQSRLGLGTWVMLLALLMGLMTSAASAVQFYRKVTKAAGRKAQQKNPERPVTFFRHE